MPTTQLYIKLQIGCLLKQNIKCLANYHYTKYCYFFCFSINKRFYLQITSKNFSENKQVQTHISRCDEFLAYPFKTWYISIMSDGGRFRESALFWRKKKKQQCKFEAGRCSSL